jgi:membrane protein DedA with SNARE-associated domain
MEQFLLTLQTTDPLWAYLVLFISAFVENVFPPIPGDTVTILGAYLVGTGSLNFWGVYLATTSGSILGFMCIYGFAFWVEWKIIEKYQPKWLSRTKIDKVETWFHDYGYWIILFNRFLSGARSVISIVAGLSKMRVFPVFTLALISCAIWNGGLIYLGSVVGKNWEEIVSFLQLYNRTVIIAIIIVLIIFVLRWFIKTRSIRKNIEGES